MVYHDVVGTVFLIRKKQKMEKKNWETGNGKNRKKGENWEKWGKMVENDKRGKCIPYLCG